MGLILVSGAVVLEMVPLISNYLGGRSLSETKLQQSRLAVPLPCGHENVRRALFVFTSASQGDPGIAQRDSPATTVK